VTEVRHWSLPDLTRVVVTLGVEAKVTPKRLSNPDRVYFDIPDTAPHPSLKSKTIPVGDERVRQIRVGQTQAGLTRVVLDLAGDADYHVSTLTNPHRLVMELKLRRSARSLPAKTEPVRPDPPPSKSPEVGPRSASRVEAAKIEFPKLEIPIPGAQFSRMVEPPAKEEPAQAAAATPEVPVLEPAKVEQPARLRLRPGPAPQTPAAEPPAAQPEIPAKVEVPVLQPSKVEPAGATPRRTERPAPAPAHAPPAPEVSPPRAVPAPAMSLAFSPDGKRAAVGGLDGTVRIQNRDGSGEARVLRGHQARVVGVTFSPDGKLLATASWDTTARLWDVASGAARQVLFGHTAAVLGVAFSPDGRLLATAGSDHTAKIWEAGSGRNLLTLSGHAGPVTSVAFSRDGSRLATTSWDRTAKVWAADDGRELVTLSGHSERLTGVAFSPDGSRLTTASWDKSLRIWEVETGKRLETLNGHADGVWAVAPSPDGKVLAAACGDGTVKLRDPLSGKISMTLSRHDAPVQWVAFAPDAKQVGTVSVDGTAKLWDVNSGKELAAWPLPGESPRGEAAEEVAKANAGAGEKEAEAGQPAVYRIGPGDVLQITVWKEPEASAPQVAVRSDGKISLPIIRELDVVGLTPSELEQILTEKYSKFIRQPDVSVVAREISSERVYLVGGVKKEGPIRWLSTMTVMMALSEGGGLTDYARKKSIYVLRTENQKQVRYPFNYEAAIKGERTDQNILLLPGDVIVVPQ
jgi:protein involved in polysaccharide export with SLBB domain